MTFLVAHFKPAGRYCTELMEQFIVTVGEALLKRLDHDYDIPVREARMECDGPDADEVLAEAEAEQEVSEPHAIHCVVDDCPLAFDSIDALNTHSYWTHIQPDPFRTSDDPLVRFERYPGATEAGDFKWFTITVTSPAPKSPAVSAGSGESSSPEVSDPPAPSGERDNTTSAVPPAAVDDPAGGTPPSPAGSPTAGEFAAVAVCNVLAEHMPVGDTLNGLGNCECAPGDSRIDDYEWREHVGAEVARRIDAAGKTLDFDGVPPRYHHWFQK